MHSYVHIYTYIHIYAARHLKGNNEYVFNTHQRLTNKTPSGRNGIGLHLFELLANEVPKTGP